MQITKITPQAKNPHRVNVYADDEFYCGVDRSVAINLSLKPGLTISPQLALQLAREETLNQVWDKALRSLQASSKSRGEMVRKLRQKFEPDVVSETLGRLQTAGLIDDARLAGAIVANYTTLQTKSVREIIAILRRRLIDPAVISEWQSALAASDQTDSITKLAAHKARSVRETDPRKRFEKIAAYLVRKGFSFGEVKKVLAEMELGD